jgi:hypothetical protein
LNTSVARASIKGDKQPNVLGLEGEIDH